MAEPKKKTAPESETPADATPAEERAEGGASDTPVEPRSYADRMERELRVPRGGEAAVIISALVELHRAGLHDGSTDGRYLKAARVIGDQLAADVLGLSDR